MTSLELIGAEVYRVGGSVRDELRGRTPNDADYMITGVSLDLLASRLTWNGCKISKLVLRNGTQIGWRAVTDYGTIEIALPRTEVSTGPHRDDFDVTVDPNLPITEDCLRRDFTVNALYRDLTTGQVLDPTGYGLADVRDRILRTTHHTSFRDDPLRMLRAMRFVARGFSVSRESEDQMRTFADAVDGLTRKGVSGTALAEIEKTLMARHPDRGLALGRDTGVLNGLLPELVPMFGFRQESRYHDLTTDAHTFLAVQHAADMKLSLRVRLALLFHDAGKPACAWRGEDGRLHYYANGDTEDHEVVGARLAHAALTRLNAPKALRRDVVTLIERHMIPCVGKVRAAKVRRWRAELGDDLLEDLLRHRLCDVMAKGTINYDQITAIDRMEHLRQEAQAAHVPMTVNDLAISGRDLKDGGATGPAIGVIQRKLLHEVLSQPKLNNATWLYERASKLIAQENRRV